MSIDPVIAHEVAEIIRDHEVSTVVTYDWGTEIVPHCGSCGYFGYMEDPALHTANVVLEFLETVGTTKGADNEG